MNLKGLFDSSDWKKRKTKPKSYKRVFTERQTAQADRFLNTADKEGKSLYYETKTVKTEEVGAGRPIRKNNGMAIYTSEVQKEERTIERLYVSE